MPIHILNNKHNFSAHIFLNEIAYNLEHGKQRSHEILILSCHVDLGLIEEFVCGLQESIRITDVYLAFNDTETDNGCPPKTGELRRIKANLEKAGINFKWAALKVLGSMHGNGYAIIQRSDNRISDGVVLITSANFTKASFTGRTIELGYSSTTKKDLKDFENKYAYLWNMGSPANPIHSSGQVFASGTTSTINSA